MLRYLLFCLLLFSASSSMLKAQLDRQHWFAPMVDRVSSGSSNSSNYQRLYLSTNRTTPFTVSIYNNNVVIATAVISKGNPQKVDIPRNMMITTQQTDLFTPVSKGLYVSADYAFYANFRFSVYNHAEIITSKGISSTGTSFFAAMAPNVQSRNYLGFMTSILATQDNTTVTVSGYKPTTVFSNGTTGAGTPTMTFTLNKGQSYIIDGLPNTPANSDAFIGAKIVANKPVNVTNGNFNGQYADPINSNSDILMDQSIPTDLLGNQFIIVKGNGNIGSNMEGALVLATENNTQVFVNNETIPLVNLNIGQYFVIPDTKYQLQGGGHYNMLIKTTKNAYVYQLLSGSSVLGVESATGGFNFIPALNCYLPKQIDELALIDENEMVSSFNPPQLNIPTKLNLITESGAVVTVNGVAPPATTGPYPVTGNLNWVTYGIPNVSGNITVNSTKAITAGITAGSDNVGYGGFFAGFPTQPVIIKSGADCAPGAILTIDPAIYDTYQWFLNGNPIPGATGATYNPTQSGSYSATVTMGSCAPLNAAAVTVKKCTVNSTASYSFCSQQIINPAFSQPTTPQSVVPSTVTIVTAPTQGTVTVNPTNGQITYNANLPGVPATDTFTYTFCGNHPVYPECETVTVNITIEQIVPINTTLNTCTNASNQGNYNLTLATVTASAGVTVTYYPTLLDAQNENTAALIATPTNYPSTAGNIVYAVIKNGTGCKAIAQITLGTFPKATVADYNGVFCDDNLDGTILVDLSTITPVIVSNSTYFTSTYHATLADANANINPLPQNWSYTTATTIYIRVNSPDGCEPVIKAINFSIGAKISVNNPPAQFACDTDFDATAPLNLANYLNLFTVDPGVAATYYNSLPNAQNSVSPLTNPVMVTGTQTFYVRFEKAGVCPNIAPITITIRTPKRSDVLADQYICKNAKTTLDAGPGFQAYLWSTGQITQSITDVGIGSYWVDLTFNGCTYRQYVNVYEASLPTIDAIEIKDGTVTVMVSGGYPPYEYSLDGIIWQTSNVFNLQRGDYVVYVRDSKRCGIVQRKFAIIDLINVITPNEDGYNDLLDYSELMNRQEAFLKVYDRYGFMLFDGNRSNRYVWNGKTYGGRAVTTGTYWYIIGWRDETTKMMVKYHSWLLIKNRVDNYYENK